MKWSPEESAELCRLAPTGCGSRAIADRLGKTRDAVIGKSHRLGVRIIDRNGFLHPTEADMARARWSKLIGPMKEQLRAEIGSM